MKFAKELSDQLVPEWQEKYLDYKQGKKKLKAVARAIRNADKSPGPSKLKTPISESLRDAPVYTFLNRDRRRSNADQTPESRGALFSGRSRSVADSPRGHDHGQEDGEQTPRASTQPVRIDERSPLNPKGTAPPTEGRGMTRYGSIIGSPPIAEESPAMSALQKQASLLELPDPALDPKVPNSEQSRGTNLDQDRRVSFGTLDMSFPQNVQLGRSDTFDSITAHHTAPIGLEPRYQSVFAPKRVNSMPADGRPFMKRMFSLQQAAPGPKPPGSAKNDIALEAYRELDFRQAEFFLFLDKQLEKIENFYEEKENQATERLKVLREQLHIMRNRRLEEVVEAENNKLKHAMNGKQANGKSVSSQYDGDEDGSGGHHRHAPGAPWLASVNQAKDKYGPGHVGKTSKALAKLGTPEAPSAMKARAAGAADQRDYTRRPAQKDVPYRIAKRKLKVALAEYYRGLELLKSYALLNRTAFRKINKKFDKTVNARPSGRYMAEKVNKAHFVNSELLDGHIQAVEDLYARYFERGSHKVAVGKLRAKIARAGDYTGSVWRQAVLASIGLVFGIEGLVYGTQQLLQNERPYMSTTASYLLQIYAGYFLTLLLATFFVIDASIFTKAKVNYPFIFEFDNRHMLDWRQLSEMPAFFTFLLGLVMWLNFQQIGGNEMYIYWPVILVGLSVAAFLLPAPYFYHRARKWFLYSNWRLLLAGIYPVEFRDFFLGDMFCSLTYALGNVELFFCLYSRHWQEPAMCNSSHSRLLGFFTTLPGIWRALQCVRRYYDTRNVFPHLVNCGKYMFTILGAMSLSLFRISKTYEMHGFFIFCATINSIYCSIWDLVMDWSLGVPSAKHPFLRHTLAYKHVWWYYAAMILDPILRFNWIFYAIYAQDLQHSSLVSFFVALSEVIRRGIWVVFRVENEHCTNVGRFRASRDIPLPYEIEDKSAESLLQKAEEEDILDHNRGRNYTDVDGPASPREPARRSEDTGRAPANRTSAHASAEERFSRRSTRSTGADLERGPDVPPSSASLRRRRGSLVSADSPIARALRHVGSTMLNAHAQDYERKRKPELDKPERDSDDDDDDDEGSSDSDTERAPPPSRGGSKKPEERGSGGSVRQVRETLGSKKREKSIDAEDEQDAQGIQQALEAAGERAR